MKKRQWWMMVCLGTLLALGCLYAAWEMHPSGTATLPGTGERQRTILRVWDVDGPTGSSAWLRAQCGKFEKIMPGLTVYLRSVPSSECFAPETVLADVICFADGTFSTPEQVLAPLHGVESVSETFLQSGRWQGEQYALPLAAEPWVLAVDAPLPRPSQMILRLCPPWIHCASKARLWLRVGRGCLRSAHGLACSHCRCPSRS